MGWGYKNRDKPSEPDLNDVNTFIYDNVVYSKDKPTDPDVENWFKIVGEGGDENVKPKNVIPKYGVLKVLPEGVIDESADFINEIIEERN